MSTRVTLETDVRAQPTTAHMEESSAASFPVAPRCVSWEGELQAGTGRPTLDIPTVTTRCVLATQAESAPDTVTPLGDWDASTIFSVSDAVDPASNVLGLTVSTARIDPADAPIYPNAVAGDPWCFVVGEEEADLGEWPGRIETNG